MKFKEFVGMFLELVKSLRSEKYSGDFGLFVRWNEGGIVDHDVTFKRKMKHSKK